MSNKTISQTKRQEQAFLLILESINILDNTFKVRTASLDNSHLARTILACKYTVPHPHAVLEKSIKASLSATVASLVAQTVKCLPTMQETWV